ncbi:hypothetical protein PQR67_06345 [Paraburkholderia fungorum]|uniref:hypothetical protein n=1 Tax=Paraburkholderia fungorum TaxID=134537 RepID=UPI0038BD68BF
MPFLDTSNSATVTIALNSLQAAIGKTVFIWFPATTDPALVARGVIFNNATPPTASAAEPNNCGQLYANRHNISDQWVDPTYSIDLPLAADWRAEVDSSSLIDLCPTFNVDVDFSNANCAPFESLVEPVHALGLTNHFDGFGQGSHG